MFSLLCWSVFWLFVSFAGSTRKVLWTARMVKSDADAFRDEMSDDDIKFFIGYCDLYKKHSPKLTLSRILFRPAVGKKAPVTYSAFLAFMLYAMAVGTFPIQSILAVTVILVAIEIAGYRKFTFHEVNNNPEFKSGLEKLHDLYKPTYKLG